jgi:hypothetical protein
VTTTPREIAELADRLYMRGGTDAVVGESVAALRDYANSLDARDATDDDIRAWISRHNLEGMSLMDLRCAFEDAQSWKPETNEHDQYLAGKPK